MDLAAQAARRDEGQAPHAVGVGQQQELGHAAAEGVADEVDVLELEVVTPLADGAGMPAQVVARVRPLAEAVTRQVQGVDAALAGEHREQVTPGAVRVGEAVQEHQRRALAGFDPVQHDAAGAYPS